MITQTRRDPGKSPSWDKLVAFGYLAPAGSSGVVSWNWHVADPETSGAQPRATQCTQVGNVCELRYRGKETVEQFNFSSYGNWQVSDSRTKVAEGMTISLKIDRDMDRSPDAISRRYCPSSCSAGRPPRSIAWYSWITYGNSIVQINASLRSCSGDIVTY